MTERTRTVAIGRIRTMAPGRPGQHLGVSHVVKHWLNPSEYWDDLVHPSVVPAMELWPSAVASKLAAAGDAEPHHSEPLDPSIAVRAQWQDLEKVVSGAYNAVIDAAFDGRFDYFLKGLSADGLSPRQGIQLPPDQQGAPGRVAAHLPGGIITIGDLAIAPAITPKDNGASSTESPMLILRTAYRPTLGRGARFGQGAARPADRQLRRELTEQRAVQAMVLLAKGDEK